MAGAHSDDARLRNRRRPNTEAHNSLHRFLAEYMERETKLLHTFCENDGGYYRWTECQEDGVRFEHPGIYTDYAKCRNRISREISDNEDGEIASYLVTKTYPDAEEPCIQSELSAAGKLFSIRESQAGPDPFEGLFFVFPTPFQKGDIVWEPNTQGYCKGPFVLTGVSGEAEASGHRRGGDNSDMTAWGYFQMKAGISTTRPCGITWIWNITAGRSPANGACCVRSALPEGVKSTKDCSRVPITRF